MTRVKNTITPSSPICFLENIFGNFYNAEREDVCELYGGAVRDALLGLTPEDYDIKVSRELYRDVLGFFMLSGRVLTRDRTILSPSDNVFLKYRHELLLITTPSTPDGITLDITFVPSDESTDDEGDYRKPTYNNCDFTVNNLKYSLIGLSKGAYRPIFGNPKQKDNGSSWTTECIQDIFKGRLRCMYNDLCPYNKITDIVEWVSTTASQRWGRRDKMLDKTHFKNCKIESLGIYQFTKHYVPPAFDLVTVFEDACPICMVPWDSIQGCILTFKCRHTFCASCSNESLKRSDLCPMCKCVLKFK